MTEHEPVTIENEDAIQDYIEGRDAPTPESDNSQGSFRKFIGKIAAAMGSAEKSGPINYF